VEDARGAAEEKAACLEAMLQQSASNLAQVSQCPSSLLFQSGYSSHATQSPPHDMFGPLPTLRSHVRPPMVNEKRADSFVAAAASQRIGPAHSIPDEA